jgi:hypothetical protein
VVEELRAGREADREGNRRVAERRVELADVFERRHPERAALPRLSGRARDTRLDEQRCADDQHHERR